MLEKKHHPVDINVGKQLRKRRLALRMSQEELARNVNLTFQQIQKYEKGYNRISCSMLYDLASVLNVQTNYFFDDMVFFDEESNTNQVSRNSIIGIATHKKIKSFEGEVNDLIECYQSIKDKKLRGQVLMLVKAFSQK